MAATTPGRESTGLRAALEPDPGEGAGPAARAASPAPHACAEGPGTSSTVFKAGECGLMEWADLSIHVQMLMGL